MEQLWVYPEEPDRSVLKNLEEKLGVSTVIAKILIKRGIDTPEKAEKFLSASLEDLHSPFLMADMDKAVSRLDQAIRKQERIMLHGDYDVDGVSAVAFMTRVLRTLGADVSHYIPHRLSEGYGMSQNGVEEAKRRDTNLIISVDCGITAVEEIRMAKELGMDVIVTDHHEPKAEIPDAVAILNPKRPDCPYPFKELAGVGVAFKLACALFEKRGIDPGSMYDFMDLVALGSTADIVPMVEENRVIVKYGLDKIGSTKNIGLRAILINSGLSGKKIGTGQVVFIIAPRINAAGRIGSADAAVEVLITEDEEKAFRIAQLLEQRNKERKEIDDRILEEATSMADEMVDREKDSAIVLAQEGWHAGVVGIVASRIVEKFYLPTILIALEDNIGKGSARSVPGFDLYEALKECQDYLLAFGGHRYAAGLTIEMEKLDIFREKFLEAVGSRLTEDLKLPKLKIDAEISFEQIDEELIEFIRLFAPFGPQNMKPVLVSKSLEVVGSPRVLKDKHLKFKAKQHGKIFDCIGFGMADYLYRVVPGEPNLDLAYAIEENEWMGLKKIQLKLKAIR